MANDPEDASVQKNATVSKGDPEQESSRDAEVLVSGLRPGDATSESMTDGLTANPAEKPGLQTSEQDKVSVTAESSGSQIQVLHRTFNTFHNFATTFGTNNATLSVWARELTTCSCSILHWRCPCDFLHWHRSWRKSCLLVSSP